MGDLVTGLLATLLAWAAQKTPQVNHFSPNEDVWRRGYASTYEEENNLRKACL